MKESNTKGLRFAAFIRVSTERQQVQGESLRTQKSDIIQAVEHLGGQVVAWYGGQEHATEGWEKQQLDRLLNDAQADNRSFDAIIVRNIDRWSRDNEKSAQGLRILKEHNVRFFAGFSELDLFNPEHELLININAAIGSYQARNQNMKSTLNRIHRAERGVPTCGKLPFGRTFNQKTETWSIDPDAQNLVNDASERYLNGESMSSIACRYGINHSNLHKILTKVSGEDWSIHFKVDSQNIDETVTIKISRLLTDDVIKAIIERASRNRTYKTQTIEGHRKYLLSGLIFCEKCGYSLGGQKSKGGKCYYRHASVDHKRPCTISRPWIPSEEIERKVFEQLFETFGNPVAVQRAIEAAVPNLERIEKLRAQMSDRQQAVAKLKSGRAKILRMLAEELISEKETKEQLALMKKQEARYLDDIAQIEERVQNVPSREEIEKIAGKVSASFSGVRDMPFSGAKTKLVATIKSINHHPEEMTWEEKRKLLELVFSGRREDGRKMGVYITWDPQFSKGWGFALHGFAESAGVTDFALSSRCGSIGGCRAPRPCLQDRRAKPTVRAKPFRMRPQTHPRVKGLSPFRSFR
jgi:DNA invertase Pin-like site-specific DNA recombinase